MTEPRHHISDETLTAYAAGSLDRALSVVVASHLTLCPACRSRQDRIEEVGGVLLDDLEPVDVAPEGLELILAQLDDEDVAKTEESSVLEARGDALEVPGPLRDLLPDTLDNIQWRGFAPGNQAVPDRRFRRSLRHALPFEDRARKDDSAPYAPGRGTDPDLAGFVQR